MQISIRICPVMIVLIVLFVIKTVSIVDIKNYQTVSTTSASIYSSLNIHSSIITNNGQTLYIASNTYVDMYNIDLAAQSMNYASSYGDSIWQITYNRIFIFNSYMIPYSTNNLYIDVFGLANFVYTQNFTINQYVDKFYYVSSKAIVLYLTTNGKFGYIHDSQFIYSPPTYLIDQSFFSASFVTFQVSGDQNYAAIAGDLNSTSWVSIYNLTSYALVCMYNLATYGIGDIAWTTDNVNLLIASGKAGFIIKLDVITCSAVQYFVTPAQTYKVMKVTYYALTNEAIFTGLQTSTPQNYAIYSYSFSSLTITFLRIYSASVSWVSYNYENDNNNFFTISHAKSVQFFQIIESCVNGTIYDSSTYLCVNSSNIMPNINATTNFLFQNTTQMKNFQSFMQDTLDNQVIMSANLVPGSRKVLQPLFTFFVNIDDLWLYNYHERDYDVVITSVFNSVQQLQNQKWTLLQFQKIWSIIDLSSNQTIQQFSSKYNYSSWRFIQVQQNSNGFILNTLNFFCSNVFFMLIIFIAFRILFFIFFNFRISIIFRQYSFWFYFMTMILEGNVQYLTYLFSFQMKNFFSINFINKTGLGIAVILYFIIFISAVAGFPIIKYHYGRFISYFSQNLRDCTASFVYTGFQTGYKNILLGFLHIMFDSNYQLKIGALILTEVVFLIFLIIFLAKERIFTNHLKVWLNIIAALLRILIIFTFFLDKDNLETDIQYAHIIIFYIYFSQMLIAISIQILRITIESIHYVCRQNSLQEESLITNQKSHQKNFSKVSNKNIRYKIQNIKQDPFQDVYKQSKQFSLKISDQNLILMKKEPNQLIKHKGFKIQNPPKLQNQSISKLRIKTNKDQIKDSKNMKINKIHQFVQYKNAKSNFQIIEIVNNK